MTFHKRAFNTRGDSRPDDDVNLHQPPPYVASLESTCACFRPSSVCLCSSTLTQWRKLRSTRAQVESTVYPFSQSNFESGWCFQHFQAGVELTPPQPGAGVSARTTSPGRGVASQAQEKPPGFKLKATVYPFQLSNLENRGSI